ncbi:MAG: hypothetical protein VXZ82_15945 [Planctomycetota bacterium]|nr:hypothetical protein [Planctomycetota bacterium]
MEDSSAFSEDSESEFVSISKLAVIALILAILSGLSIISPGVVFVSVVAVVLALIAGIRIQRDSQLGGGHAAMLALVISCFTGAWSITAARQTNQKLYGLGAVHAKTYLEAIASGETFQAMEMRKEEHAREVIGAQLGLKYGGESKVKAELDQFLGKPGTKLIQESGRDSQWELSKGLSTQQADETHRIVLLMQNQKNTSQQIVVTLFRRFVDSDEGGVALWHIVDHATVD